jgi:hypothetical protein
MNLYHYCPNEAFHSIISNKEIRLSSLSQSNDFMEGKIFEKELFKFAEQDKLKNEQMEGFKKALSFLSSNMDGLGFCFSKEGDLLSQWRGYASNGHGVSIGFSKHYLETLSQHTLKDVNYNFSLNEVIYDPVLIAAILKPTYQLIKKDIDAGAFRNPVHRSLISQKTEEEVKEENEIISNKNKAIFEKILSMASVLYFLKSTAFKEEIESRLISILIKNRGESPDSCLFQPFLNKIKPYRQFKLVNLKVKPIEEIIVGPKNSTPIHVIDSFMRQNGFIDVKVSKSSASYI